MSEQTKNNNEIYVYLEFNEKLDQEFFKKPDLFFKVVNLHKKKPLVQIGNYVFQGVYEDCIGTNVFLKESEQPPKLDVFKRKTPIHLDFFTKTVKCINLKWLKIPEQITQVEPAEMVKLNLAHDYRIVLKKLKEGKLNLDDIVAKKSSKVENSKPKYLKKKCTTKENTDTPSTNQDTEKKSNVDTKNVEAKSSASLTNPAEANKLLQKLLKVPTKTKTNMPKYYKLDATHLVDGTQTKNILILKQLYLQNLNYKDISAKIDESKLVEYVNLENSVKDGIIKESDCESRTFSEEEKNELISMKNFHNLRVPLQLSLLVEQLKLEKERLCVMTEEEIQTVDEYGRTPRDRYRLLKTFAKDIWYYMFVQVRDQEYREKTTKEKENT